jgi:hypothetical protein
MNGQWYNQPPAAGLSFGFTVGAGSLTRSAGTERLLRR